MKDDANYCDDPHHHLRPAPSDIRLHSKKYSNIPLLVCAFLAASTTGGVVYSFGFFGGELKSNFDLTQSQLDTISSANFCVSLFNVSQRHKSSMFHRSTSLHFVYSGPS